MTYRVLFDEDAYEELSHLDRGVNAFIRSWLRKNLEGTDDPYVHGKPLKGKYRGLWRYRIGDYRVCAQIRESEDLILVVGVRHRSNAYNR